MVRQKILVILLGGVKRPAHLYRRDNAFLERAAAIQLCDVRPGHRRLFGVGRKNRRSVLRARIGSLTIQLRRIVSDREEHVQQLPVADLPRIEGDLYRLGVTGRAAIGLFVGRRALCSARISGDRLLHAFDVLKDALHAPEAAAGKHRHRR
jgi:hypothetical protein